MSIFDKIGNALDPSKNGVNNFFRGVPNNVQKPINDAVSQIKNQLQQVERDIENELHKVRDSIQNEVVSNITRVGGDLESVLKKVGGELESVANKVKWEIESGGKTAIAEIESTGKKVVDELDNEIEKVLDSISEGFKEKAVKAALTSAKEIATEIPLTDISLTLSVITFSISSPGEKIPKIEKYINKPPSGEDEVVAMLKDIGVGSVNVSISGEFFSSAISAGVSFTVDLAESAEFMVVIKKQIEKIVKLHKD